MPRELQVSFNGTSAALYVIVRLESDGSVWNTATSALETFAAGSITDYDIALTDDGGDLYVGDIPADLPAGDYRFQYYERSGASPATTDTLLKSPLRHWNGAVLSSTSDVTISPYALTTLASVKRRLEIEDSDSDTTLTEIINGVSAEIERVTGVAFAARDYRQWLDGANQREMVLPHYPVQHMTRIAFGVANAMTVTYTGAGIRASASVYKSPESADAGGLRLVTISAVGVTTETNLSFATYPSLTVLATAVAAVSGWSATVLVNQPSRDLHPGGGEDALNRAVTFTYPDRDEYGYSINHDTGTLTFNRGDWWCLGTAGGHQPAGVSGWYQPMSMPRRFQGVLCEYRAGWETIPADVQTVCNELVQDNYFTAQIGAGVSEVKLGPSTLKISDSQADTVRDRLSHYIDLSRMIGGAK